jgi:4-hydroxybenzoate polyprenyltransferase
MTPRPFEDKMALALQATTTVALIAAILAVSTPGRTGEVFGVAVVSLLVAVPLIRVAALVVRWHHQSDRQFVLVGIGLVALVGIGAIIAFVR